jgi:hypothetical protein
VKQYRSAASCESQIIIQLFGAEDGIDEWLALLIIRPYQFHGSILPLNDRANGILPRVVRSESHLTHHSHYVRCRKGIPNRGPVQAAPFSMAAAATCFAKMNNSVEKSLCSLMKTHFVGNGRLGRAPKLVEDNGGHVANEEPYKIAAKIVPIILHCNIK